MDASYINDDVMLGNPISHLDPVQNGMKRDPMIPTMKTVHHTNNNNHPVSHAGLSPPPPTSPTSNILNKSTDMKKSNIALEDNGIDFNIPEEDDAALMQLLRDNFKHQNR
eukprot:UN00086